MKNFDQYLVEKNATYSYGCVMLDIDGKTDYNKLVIRLIKILQQLIPDEELYIDKKQPEKLGKELESHVTLLYGLHKEVSDEDVERIIKDWAPINLKITGISIFENSDKDYDVVKLDVDPKTLSKYNKELKKFPFTNDYPDYHPHITLAYVKKGFGKKYTLKFDEPILVKDLTTVTYSQADKTKKSKYQIEFKA